MEQHPVPRNIAGFQFRLIGDMTLHQFGYLVAGGVAAYIIFKILPLPPSIKFVPAVISLITGFAFAFVPIQERPLDRWFVAFIKSIYSPTQFVWKKVVQPPRVLVESFSSQTPLKKDHVPRFQESKKKLQVYLQSLPPSPHLELDTHEQKFLSYTLSLFEPQTEKPIKPQTPLQEKRDKNNEKAKKKGSVFEEAYYVEKTPPPMVKQTKIEVEKEEKKPEQPPVGQLDNLQFKDKELKKEIESLQEKLHAETVSKERFMELQEKINLLLKEKEELTNRFNHLQKKFSARPKDIVTPGEYQEEKRVSKQVRRITPKSASEFGLTQASDLPNILSGVIKDSGGGFLPGIIVTVKNTEGILVRALKTNKLGQFASSTPLSKGVHIIEIEDPLKRFKFDIIEIELKDTAYPPLEIRAKSEKDQARQQLVQELFGRQ